MEQNGAGDQHRTEIEQNYQEEFQEFPPEDTLHDDFTGSKCMASIPANTAIRFVSGEHARIKSRRSITVNNYAKFYD